MATHLRANLVLAAGSLFVCCGVYPALLLAFGQGAFPTAASGSLVTGPDGKPVGSSLIAQAFTKDGYFWPRPSAAGYNAAATGGSNWGGNNPKLRDRVAQQLGPLVQYKSGKPVGPDIEAWFVAVPDRAAKWAAAYPTSAAAWAKADLAGDKYGPTGEYVRAWATDHPAVTAEWRKANPTRTDDPKPEDLVGPFFDSFVTVHPGTFPAIVDEKAADGSTVKVVRPTKEGTAVQAAFFESWLQDPANAPRAADIEPVPADFVTASGAGVDPHITLRNALSVYQLDRVARARGASREAVADLVRSRASAPLAGLAGEPLVNVLELNLELDAKLPAAAR